MKSLWPHEEERTVAVMEPESFMIGRPLTRDDVLDAAEVLATFEHFDFSPWAVASPWPVDAPPGSIRRRTLRP